MAFLVKLERGEKEGSEEGVFGSECDRLEVVFFRLDNFLIGRSVSLSVVSPF